jgi:hypothetical protein
LPTKIPKRERNVTTLEFRDFLRIYKSDAFYSENPRRYTIGEVELGVNYVLIISTNAGLWG